MPATTSKTRSKTRRRKHNADFPLAVHPRGHWFKKIHGTFHYFGKVDDDPKGVAALDRWLAVKDDLLAGRDPRPQTHGVQVRDLLNAFDHSKRDRLAAGEIVPSTYNAWVLVCDLIRDAFGASTRVADLRPTDFSRLRAKLARTHSVGTLGNDVARIRSVFRYGVESGLIDKAVLFGPDFRRPAKRLLRLARQAKGPKLFDREELQTLLKAASPKLKAMILLALNCGFGNADVGRLQLRHVDLKRGWVEMARGKTGVERRCPLWPETVEALKAVIADRPKAKAKEHANLVFLTCRGDTFFKGAGRSPVGCEFSELLERAGVDRGRGFYALRHTFATIGAETRDAHAVSVLLGHEIAGQISAYVEHVGDDRLRAVTDHVRGWLYSRSTKPRPR